MGNNSSMSSDYGMDVSGAAIATAAKCGAASVCAADRTIVVEAEYRGLTIKVPYIFDSDGKPRAATEAMELAKALYNEAHPRREGRYVMGDLASLIAWGKRYAMPNTVALVSQPTLHEPGVVSVTIDGLPDKGDDGSLMRLWCSTKIKLHDRLCAWLAADRSPMNVDTFADFATRATDELTGTELISMISNVEVKEESTWVRAMGPDGLIRVTEESSKRATKVPPTFSFAVPVFDGDEEGNVCTFRARLTVKIAGKKPMFTYEITDFKPRLAEAMATIAKALEEVTPHVYMGPSG